MYLLQRSPYSSYHVMSYQVCAGLSKGKSLVWVTGVNKDDFSAELDRSKVRTYARPRLGWSLNPYTGLLVADPQSDQYTHLASIGPAEPIQGANPGIHSHPAASRTYTKHQTQPAKPPTESVGDIVLTPWRALQDEVWTHEALRCVKGSENMFGWILGQWGHGWCFMQCDGAVGVVLGFLSGQNLGWTIPRDVEDASSKELVTQWWRSTWTNETNK